MGVGAHQNANCALGCRRRISLSAPIHPISVSACVSIPLNKYGRKKSACVRHLRPATRMNLLLIACAEGADTAPRTPRCISIGCACAGAAPQARDIKFFMQYKHTRIYTTACRVLFLLSRVGSPQLRRRTTKSPQQLQPKSL
jgi:hypothetical protein